MTPNLNIYLNTNLNAWNLVIRDNDFVHKVVIALDLLFITKLMSIGGWNMESGFGVPYYLECLIFFPNSVDSSQINYSS